MKIRTLAYAKINLFLDVTGIRDDGYHNVETVMQSISLCDLVDVELLDDGKIIIECDVEGVPLNEKNIAYKAAKLFFECVESNKGARIIIKKNIPMAAGLAGGSADGAAVLIALNTLFDEALSMDELCELGSKLGADVPFCIMCGCMYSDGRGDHLSKFTPIPKDVCFVIACGGEGVSTPEAYRLLDTEYNNFFEYEKKGVNSLKEKMLIGNISFSDELFNLFEKTISEKRPVVNEIKCVMDANGAKRSMMSGSGPSVFGVFSNFQEAKKVSEKITEKGYFATVAYPIFDRK